MVELGETPAGWMLAGVGAVATFVVGLVSGRAQIVTAASKAADMIIEREGQIIERQEKRIQQLEAQDKACREALDEVREQLALVRVASGLPPYEFRAPVRAESPE